MPSKDGKILAWRFLLSKTVETNSSARLVEWVVVNLICQVNTCTHSHELILYKHNMAFPFTCIMKLGKSLEAKVHVLSSAVFRLPLIKTIEKLQMQLDFTYYKKNSWPVYTRVYGLDSISMITTDLCKVFADHNRQC